MRADEFMKPNLATLIVAATLVGIAPSGAEEAAVHQPSNVARDLPAVTASWDAKAAAAYLDQRATWWTGWQDASREKGTFCVSCHTAVPYALARPALRKALGEASPTGNERLLLESVRKRVRLWKEIAPVYNDKEYGANKGVESRATEAVLNAFLLANLDSADGKLSDDAKTAFSNLWALQQTSGDNKGAWLWQLFDLNPWEGNISPYYGATLAAIAVGAAPGNYRATPEIQTNIQMLREYLDREYAAQPTINRVMLLWASAKLPGLLSPSRQKSIVQEVLSKQEADGGWSLFPLSRTWKDWEPSALVGKWNRADGTPQELKSDGLATGLTTYVLRQAGVSRQNAQLERARAWLAQNQAKPDGLWLGYSLNKRRDPSSNAGRFMSDAATAFAVLALTEDN
ncbi:MAG: terpene cyclase/mutase family protein [Candidatus Acidiferrum sp.]